MTEIITDPEVTKQIFTRYQQGEIALYSSATDASEASARYNWPGIIGISHNGNHAWLLARIESRHRSDIPGKARPARVRYRRRNGSLGECSFPAPSNRTRRAEAGLLW